jgi:hypothetical protein
LWQHVLQQRRLNKPRNPPNKSHEWQTFTPQVGQPHFT